jgi:hypothetical protein
MISSQNTITRQIPHKNHDPTILSPLHNLVTNKKFPSSPSPPPVHHHQQQQQQQQQPKERHPKFPPPTINHGQGQTQQIHQNFSL